MARLSGAASRRGAWISRRISSGGVPGVSDSTRHKIKTAFTYCPSRFALGGSLVCARVSGHAIPVPEVSESIQLWPGMPAVRAGTLPRVIRLRVI